MSIEISSNKECITMTTCGYSSVKQKRDTIVSALQDISVLIGKSRPSQTVLNTNSKAFAPGLGLISDADNIMSISNSIRQGVLNLMVLGVFKSGKSTLLNAILGEEALIAKAAPATAIITTAVYGQDKNVKVYYTNRNIPRILSWSDFKSEFQLTHRDQETFEKQGFVDRFLDIEFAQIERQHKLLESGIILIDSPGLGEEISRTKVTTEFLKISQAVIFVLDATRILSRDEKVFIDSIFGPGRLDHVFFVVNKIDQVSKSDIDEIKIWVRNALDHHFLDEDGNFDEDFYNNRVFFVSGRVALEARKGASLNETCLKESGVTMLENELELFLTNDDKVLQATLKSTVENLIYIISKACKQIDLKKIALNQPLEELERRQKITEKRLEDLEKEKDRIERDIIFFGNRISERIYGNLLNYIDEMSNTWNEDSKNITNFDEIGWKTIFSATAFKKSKLQMESVIQREISKYLNVKFELWANQIPNIVYEDLEHMRELIQKDGAKFQLELSQIKTIFATGTAMTNVELDVEKGKIDKMIQMAFAVWTLDPSQVTGIMSGKGDWESFVERLTLDLVIITLTVVIFGVGWAALITYIVAELLHISWEKNSFKDHMTKGIGTELFKSLPAQIEVNEKLIRGKIQQPFDKIAHDIIGTFQTQIDDIRADQESIINKRRDTLYAADLEMQRLSMINETLIDLFNVISVQLYGRSMTLDEIHKLAENKNAVLDSGVA